MWFVKCLRLKWLFFSLGWKNLMTFESFTSMIPSIHPQISVLNQVKLYSTNVQKGGQGSQTPRTDKAPPLTQAGVYVLAQSLYTFPLHWGSGKWLTSLITVRACKTIWTGWRGGLYSKQWPIDGRWGPVPEVIWPPHTLGHTYIYTHRYKQTCTHVHRYRPEFVCIVCKHCLLCCVCDSFFILMVFPYF